MTAPDHMPEAFKGTCMKRGIHTWSLRSTRGGSETGSEARSGIGRWIGYYNADRPHSSFGGSTPDEVYAIQATEVKLAA